MIPLPCLLLLGVPGKPPVSIKPGFWDKHHLANDQVNFDVQQWWKAVSLQELRGSAAKEGFERHLNSIHQAQALHIVYEVHVGDSSQAGLGRL
jgi:hypothetical protein